MVDDQRERGLSLYDETPLPPRVPRRTPTDTTIPASNHSYPYYQPHRTYNEPRRGSYNSSIGGRRMRDPTDNWGYDGEYKRQRTYAGDPVGMRRPEAARTGVLSFKDWLANQPDSISAQRAQEEYDKYVRDASNGGLASFFDEHKEEEWFKEKYHPANLRAAEERIRKQVQARAAIYKENFEKYGSEGVAPRLVEVRKKPPEGWTGIQAQQDSKLAGQLKVKKELKKEDTAENEVKMEPRGPEKDSAGLEGAALEAHGSPTGVKEEAEPDRGNASEEQSNEREAAEQEKSKSTPQEEEVKVESVKEEHGERTDNEPASAKTMESSATVDAASQKETQTDSKHGDSALAIGRSAPVMPEVKQEVTRPQPRAVYPTQNHGFRNTLFIRKIPKNASREALEKVLRTGPSGTADLSLVRLKLGEVNPARHLQRFGWAVYNSEEEAAEALKLVNGAEIEQMGKDGPFRLDAAVNVEKRKKPSQEKSLTAISASKTRLSHDAEQAEKLMRHLDQQRQVDKSLCVLTPEFLAARETDEERVDHCIWYLREVHYYCYYTGSEYMDDPSIMPEQEVRPFISSDAALEDAVVSEKPAAWEKRVDERAAHFMSRTHDLKTGLDNAEVLREKRLKEWFDRNTKNEGQGRYRCGQPPFKLFKGPEFVRKHLRTKHTEAMNKILDAADAEIFRENFFNDPNKRDLMNMMEPPHSDSYAGGPGPGPRPSYGGGLSHGGVRTMRNDPPYHSTNAGMGMNIGSNMGPGMMGPGPMMGGMGTGMGQMMNSAMGGMMQGMAGGMHGGMTGGVAMGMQPYPMMMVAPSNAYAMHPPNMYPMSYGGRFSQPPGSYPRHGGSSYRGRGHSGYRPYRGDGRMRGRRGPPPGPLDPRASRPLTQYNDLDAPAATSPPGTAGHDRP